MLDNETEETVDEVVQSAPASRPTRAPRSEIAFPYASMEDAFSVVQALADVGVELSRDQLSAKMAFPTSSFNVRLGAARMFGLIYATKEGFLGLTKDGRRIASNDFNEAALARRDAFLNVALYRRTFEAFQGRNFPDPSALEEHFARLGVAPKQTDKARSAFERSALYAGFFHAGRNRLVEPIINRKPTTTAQEAQSDRISEKTVSRSLPDEANQSLIKGLLERLPPADSGWSLDARARWLRALAVNLAVIYGPEDEVELEIKVPTRGSIVQAVKPISPAPQKPVATTSRPTRPESGNWDAPKGGDLDDEIPF